MPDPVPYKYTAAEVKKLVDKGELVPNNLRVTDFKSEKDYIDYFKNNYFSPCNGQDQCAEFAHDRVGYAIGLNGHKREVFNATGYEIGLGGAAWQDYGNILDAGGKSVYNTYNGEGDLSNIRVGDIVGLGVGRLTDSRNRGMYGDAYKEAKRDVDNSHAGVVAYIDSEGTPWVQHLIRDHVITSPLKKDKDGKVGLLQDDGTVGTWTLATAARPNYKKYSHAKINISNDGTPYVKQYDLEKAGYNPKNSINISVGDLRIPIDSEDRDYTQKQIDDIKKKFFLPNNKNGDILAQRLLDRRNGERVAIDDSNEDMSNFIKSLNDNKKDLMKYYELTEDEYNKLAINALGIIGQESSFGNSNLVGAKDMFETVTQIAKFFRDGSWSPSEEMSKGMGQVKPYSINKNFTTKFGINDDNFSDPSNQALLVMSHLYDDVQKAKLWGPKNTSIPEKLRNDPYLLAPLAYNIPGEFSKGNISYNQELGDIMKAEGFDNIYFKNVDKFKKNFEIYNEDTNPYTPIKSTIPTQNPIPAPHTIPPGGLGGFAYGGHLNNSYAHGGYVTNPPPETEPTNPLPFPNLPAASHADSLALYQNALDKIKFYDDDIYGFGYNNNSHYPEQTNFTDPENILRLIERSRRGYGIPNDSFEDLALTDDQVDEFKKAANKNLPQHSEERRFGPVSSTGLYQFGDILNSKPDRWFNPWAPPILLHPNVIPQNSLRYDSDSAGDATEIPYYDPIAIQPWSEQSEENRKKRLEKYGIVGTPFSSDEEAKKWIENHNGYKAKKTNVSTTSKPKPIHPVIKMDPLPPKSINYSDLNSDTPRTSDYAMRPEMQHTLKHGYKFNKATSMYPNDTMYTVSDKNGYTVNGPDGKPSIKSFEDRQRLNPQNYYSPENAPWLYDSRQSVKFVKPRKETKAQFAYGGPTDPPMAKSDTTDNSTRGLDIISSYLSNFNKNNLLHSPNPTLYDFKIPISTAPIDTVDSSILRDAMSSIVPSNLLALNQSLNGGNAPFTENFFKNSEKDAMWDAINNAKKKGHNYVTYNEYPHSEDVFEQDKISKYLTPSLQVRTTLGQFNFQQNPDSSVTIHDSYDFNPTYIDAHKISKFSEDSLRNMSNYDRYIAGLNFYNNKSSKNQENDYSFGDVWADTKKLAKKFLPKLILPTLPLSNQPLDLKIDDVVKDKAMINAKNMYKAMRYWVAPYGQQEPIPVEIHLPQREQDVDKKALEKNVNMGMPNVAYLRNTVPYEPNKKEVGKNVNLGLPFIGYPQNTKKYGGLINQPIQNNNETNIMKHNYPIRNTYSNGGYVYTTPTNSLDNFSYGGDIAGGAGKGAMLGANPALVAATGGLSIVAGGLIGGGMGYLQGQREEEEARKLDLNNRRSATDAYNNPIGLGNPALNINSSYAMGGQMPINNQQQMMPQQQMMQPQQGMLQQKGMLTEAEGPSHAQGGISIGGGNEVEGGETINNSEEGSYVFSDRVGPDGFDGLTYADMSKEINDKLTKIEEKAEKQGRKLDNYTKGTYERLEAKVGKELKDLEAQQENDPLIKQLRKKEEEKQKNKELTLQNKVNAIKAKIDEKIANTPGAAEALGQLQQGAGQQMMPQQQMMQPIQQQSSPQQQFAYGGSPGLNGDPVFANINEAFFYISQTRGEDIALQMQQDGSLNSLLNIESMDEVNQSLDTYIQSFNQVADNNQASIIQDPVINQPSIETPPAQPTPVITRNTASTPPPVHPIDNELTRMPSIPPRAMVNSPFLLTGIPNDHNINYAQISGVGTGMNNEVTNINRSNLDPLPLLSNNNIPQSNNKSLPNPQKLNYTQPMLDGYTQLGDGKQQPLLNPNMYQGVELGNNTNQLTGGSGPNASRMGDMNMMPLIPPPTTTNNQSPNINYQTPNTGILLPTDPDSQNNFEKPSWPPNWLYNSSNQTFVNSPTDPNSQNKEKKPFEFAPNNTEELLNYLRGGQSPNINYNSNNEDFVYKGNQDYYNKQINKGMYASMVGPVFQAADAMSGYEKENLPRVNSRMLDDTGAQNISKRNYALGQANLNKAASSAGTSAGNYMTNLTAGTVGMAGNAAAQAVGIKQQYDNANVGIKNKDLYANNQIAMQEKVFNQQNKAAQRNMFNSAITNIGTNIASGNSDKTKFFADNNYNEQLLNMLNSQGYNFIMRPDGTTEYVRL